MTESKLIEYHDKQAKIKAFIEAAFQGKSNMDLVERNNNWGWGGEGTVFTRRNNTLGNKEFGYPKSQG